MCRSKAAAPIYTVSDTNNVKNDAKVLNLPVILPKGTRRQSRRREPVRSLVVGIRIPLRRTKTTHCLKEKRIATSGFALLAMTEVDGSRRTDFDIAAV